MENQDGQAQENTTFTDTPSVEEVIPSVDEQKPIGPIVGIVIIVVLIVVAGLYFWGNQLFDGKGSMSPDTEVMEGAGDPVTDALGEQSTSDDVGSIEDDLDLTDLESLDADLENIDEELSL